MLFSGCLGVERLSEQFKFLAELTPYCIEARYGDYKESLSEIINKKKAKEVYQKTEEIFSINPL